MTMTEFKDRYVDDVSPHLADLLNYGTINTNLRYARREDHPQHGSTYETHHIFYAGDRQVTLMVSSEEDVDIAWGTGGQRYTSKDYVDAYGQLFEEDVSAESTR